MRVSLASMINSLFPQHSGGQLGLTLSVLFLLYLPTGDIHSGVGTGPAGSWRAFWRGIGRLRWRWARPPVQLSWSAVPQWTGWCADPGYYASGAVGGHQQGDQVSCSDQTFLPQACVPGSTTLMFPSRLLCPGLGFAWKHLNASRFIPTPFVHAFSSLSLNSSLLGLASSLASIKLCLVCPHWGFKKCLHCFSWVPLSVLLYPHCSL